MYGRVVGVTDRDSLKILVAEQQLLRVRIAICDASEKRQPFGTRAKQARCMSFEFFGFFTFGPFFVTVAGSTILSVKAFVGGRARQVRPFLEPDLMAVPALQPGSPINRINLVLCLLARLVFDRSFSSFTPS